MLGAASGSLAIVWHGGAAWAHTSSGGNNPSLAHRLADLTVPVLVGLAVGVYLFLTAVDYATRRLRNNARSPDGHAPGA